MKLRRAWLGMLLAAPFIAAGTVPAHAADDPTPPTMVSVGEDFLHPDGAVLTTQTNGRATTVTTSRNDVGGLGWAWGGVSATTATYVDTGLPSQTVYGNLTAVNTATGGYTTAWPCDQDRPFTSVNNYTPGTPATPNFAAVKTDGNGNACFYTSGQAELLWDQYGGTSVTPAHTATRVFDTRNSGAPLPATSVYTMHTATPNTTIAGNLTVTQPVGSGFTTVYPCAEGRPNASVNNYVAGQTTPNFAVTTTDGNGDVCFYVSNTTHILWDQVAELSPASLTSQKAGRLLDTRTGAGQVPAGGTVRVSTGRPATTVFGNLTVTEPVGGGYTTVWDCSTPRPFTSVNNYVARQTTPNFAAVKTDANGDFCLYTSNATHLLWDSTGYSTAFSLATPTRLLDTRNWGGGLDSPANDTHWLTWKSGSGANSRWNPCTTIPVYLNKGTIGDAEFNNLRIAIGLVQKATGLNIYYVGDTTEMPKSGQGTSTGRLVFAFAPPGATDLFQYGSVGWGGASIRWSGEIVSGYVAISEADIVRAPNNARIRIYMHEIGHAIGLDHVTDVHQVMNPVTYNTAPLWGRGDMHGLAAVGVGPGCKF